MRLPWDALQPRRPYRVVEVIHLMSWVVREETRVRPLAIPRPFVHKLRRKTSFQHIDDVLAQNREEFKAVEVAASCDVKALGCGVRRDDEVGACGEGIPRVSISMLDMLPSRNMMTYQQIRCFSILKSAPFLP